MDDRVVVRVPQNNSNVALHLQGLLALSAVAVSIAAAYRPDYISLIISFGRTSLLIDLLAISCIICIAKAWIRRRGTFKEAVVEVTPLGVQLMSIYGTPTYSLTKKIRDNQCKTRAFVPKERIVDVIVMEVVWPHCVWSQVAFRVVNNAPSNDEKAVYASSKTNKKPNCQSHTVHELLQQQSLAIIPCFPDECRGLLTYKQCLGIQSEIEKLLKLPVRS